MDRLVNECGPAFPLFFYGKRDIDSERTMRNSMTEFGASLVETVRQNPGAALLMAAGAYLLLLVILLGLIITVIVITRRQSRLLRGTQGESLEDAIQRQLDSVTETRSDIQMALQQGENNTETLRHCLQRVGIIRYDAFPDVGGEQSFSIALLDTGGNGIVLSGLHSRQDVRVYAKPIIANDSPVMLTTEERKAVSNATTSTLAQSVPTQRTGKRRE
jgi:hypothetical protein